MASRKQNFNAGTSFLAGKGKTPTYLYVPDEKLPGIFNPVPVNRAARRKEAKFTPPSVFPLMRVMGGYQRLEKGQHAQFWRESRRDWIRMMQGRISKETLKAKILRRTK